MVRLFQTCFSLVEDVDVMILDFDGHFISQLMTLE